MSDHLTSGEQQYAQTMLHKEALEKHPVVIVYKQHAKILNGMFFGGVAVGALGSGLLAFVLGNAHWMWLLVFVMIACAIFYFKSLKTLENRMRPAMEAALNEVALEAKQERNEEEELEYQVARFTAMYEVSDK